MNDRKIWKILSALTVKEAEAFNRWLEAEMAGKQIFLRTLSAILAQNLKQAPSAEQVWDQLYPEKAYDDDRMRKLNGDLTYQLEEFMAIQAFRADRDTRDLFLLREMSSRKRPDVFTKLYRKIHDRLSRRTNKNADYYRMLFEVEEEKQRFDRIHRIPYVLPKSSTEGEQSLKNMSQMQRINYAFDSWWLHEKMEIAPHNMNSMELHQESIESVLLEEVLELIETHPLHSKQPWLTINKQVMLFLQQPESVPVTDIMILLEDRRADLEKKEVHALWGFLINHYARKLNKSGEVDSARHLVSLYEWAIHSELIFVDKYLPIQHYRNIITISLRIPAFDLAYQYLHTFKPLISPEKREDTFIFNLAKYHYAKEEYQSVIDLLSNHKFAHSVDEIDARAFLLQSQYELNTNDTEWLFGQAENLIRYVRNRRAIPKRIKQLYINQYRLFNRVLNANTDNKLARVKLAVQENRAIIQPRWLIKMIDQKRALIKQEI